MSVLSSYNHFKIDSLVHVFVPSGASGGRPLLCNNKFETFTPVCGNSGIYVETYSSTLRRPNCYFQSIPFSHNCIAAVVAATTFVTLAISKIVVLFIGDISGSPSYSVFPYLNTYYNLS